MSATPSAAARGFWTVSGSLLFAATIWWAAYNISTLVGHDERTETATFDAADVARIDIDNGAGGITVRGTDAATAAGTITLVAEISDGVRATENRHEVVDGTLVVRASCPIFGSAWCDARYTLDVPHGIELRLEADNDRIRVFDISGPVDAHSSNGSVSMVGVSGEIDASSDNGRVSGDGLTADIARFDTDNGSVAVRFATPPADVVADTSNGSVTIEVPSGDAYAVDTSTGNGSIDVDVDIDDDAGRRIDASTDNGSITIRYRD